MWSKKKEQQTVFDEVLHDVSNFKSDLPRALSQKDGILFIQKWLDYVRRIPKVGVIIDIGCGSGSLFEEINHHDALKIHNYVGIDISPKSLKIAKQKNRYADFIVCDMDILPLRDNVCDMAVLRNVLHHSLTLTPLSNAVGVLNSKGFLLIDDKISGNPLQEILILVYPLIPYSFKMILRENTSHIDRSGDLPPTTYRRPKAYLDFVKEYSNELRIEEVYYHGFLLFLEVLNYLYHFFPWLSNVHMPIYRLYSFERRKIMSWSAVSMTIIAERV